MSDPLRRRSVGAPAARSVLLTILGQYALPRRGPVWQETLVAALGELGISVHAARQALARSARDGWLITERRGRRTRMSLSPSTSALLRSGAQRIYAFGEDEPWDGQWLVVVLRVPEQQRDVRHQLRTRLAWAGLGSLGGGIWITPRVEREAEVVEIVSGEHFADVVSFRGAIGSLGEPGELLRTAWDLESVSAAYAEFIDEFSSRRATTPAAAFAAQTMLVHAWRKFPFLDPEIPAELLPTRWPRRRAHQLFVDRHARWEPLAREHFELLEAGVTESAA